MLGIPSRVHRGSGAPSPDAWPGRRCVPCSLLRCRGRRCGRGRIRARLTGRRAIRCAYIYRAGCPAGLRSQPQRQGGRLAGVGRQQRRSAAGDRSLTLAHLAHRTSRSGTALPNVPESELPRRTAVREPGAAGRLTVLVSSLTAGQSRACGVQLLGDTSLAGYPADDAPGAAAVQPPLVGSEEDGSFAALADGQVDRTCGARRKRDGDDLAALAGDNQRAVAAFCAHALDIRTGRLRYSQPVELKQ